MFKVNRPFLTARGWVCSVFMVDGAAAWTLPHVDRNAAVRAAYTIAR
jgi:hypothetical protein